MSKKKITINLDISAKDLYERVSRNNDPSDKEIEEFMKDVINAVNYQIDWENIIENLRMKYRNN